VVVLRELEFIVAKVNIVIDRGLNRAWHIALGKALEEEGHVVGWRSSGNDPRTTSAALSLLLWLERNMSVDAAHSWDQFLAPASPPDAPWHIDSDVTLDLSTGPPIESTLRINFGGTDELGCFALLLDGGTPRIEIQDYPHGRLIAVGTPSLENKDTIAAQFSVIARTTIQLVLRALAGTPCSATNAIVASGLSHGSVLHNVRRRLTASALRAVYARCCFSPHWQVGWRNVDIDDVWTTLDLSGPSWVPLAHPAFRFLADPFPFSYGGHTYVFAEDYDHRVGKGTISFVPFDFRGPVGPAQPVLEEPWHLSYPFLIEHGGSVWMIPEASASGQVVAYRADPFPTRWIPEAILISAFPGTDATIVRHSSKFWMFVTGARGPEYSDTLSLYHAEDLLGPWQPHDLNPVLIDAGSARSAGRIVERAGKLYRPVQDCRGGYGRGLGLARIDVLDCQAYQQTLLKTVYPGKAWPGRRLHTLNRSQHLECIDGSANAIRLLEGSRQITKEHSWRGPLAVA
jgi:hypothetical protein